MKFVNIFIIALLVNFVTCLVEARAMPDPRRKKQSLAHHVAHTAVGLAGHLGHHLINSHFGRK